MATSSTTRAGLPIWTVAALLAGFSILAVYVTSGSLHVMDLQTRTVYADESLHHYEQALNGERAFPYQWRLLGVYMVSAGERLSGADPHAVDVATKVILLWAASALLLVFTRLYASPIGALCAVCMYFVLTTAGFTEGYSIYFTNDYAMLVAWFAAVLLVRQRRFAAAAAVTFIGAWAKETMMLVPILVGIEWLRGRAPFKAVTWLGIAFVIPSAALRWIYPAPIGRWAWWDMAYANVPFLQNDTAELLLTLKNNAKVFLFFNVLWILAAIGIRRSRDGFLTSLGLTALTYVVLAYPVIYIRELRHFLPLAILILPIAIRELERGMAATSDPTTPPAGWP
jgi:hypothetical protein